MRLVGTGAIVLANHGARRRVDISGSEMYVRLQVGSFCPFVPCIDKNKRFAAETMLACPVDESFHPVLISRRSRVGERVATSLSASIIVPRWNGSPNERIRRVRLAQRFCGRVFVVPYFAGERRVEDVDIIGDPSLAQLMRRKLYRAVKTECRRIMVVKHLRHQ